jgi:phosphate transport system substrate-binding protein
MKKLLIISISLIVLLNLVACNENTKGFKPTNDITVVSRESSSGTRGAFDELMKITVKENDKTVDKLFSEAVIVESSDSASSKVEVDNYAIGYTSLGGVTDKVKALTVNGVENTVANVKNGSYKISRPFVLATKGDSDELAADFISYVNSKEGQKLVAEKGYIMANDNAPTYISKNKAGKITIAGSTSFEKLMEKFKEEYMKLNPDVTVEVIYSGSTAGIKDAKDGKVQIAMSSRELKAEEKAILKDFNFALDGIAVIVNKENPITSITTENINKIYTGEIRKWADVK